MRLLPEAASAGVARRYVGRCLAGWCGNEASDTAVLLTSEVVTNAVLHGGPHQSGSALVLDVDLDELRVHVAVLDHGHGPVVVAAAGPEASSGRGLQMVELLASGWGVVTTVAGNSVWFEVHALHLR